MRFISNFKKQDVPALRIVVAVFDPFGKYFKLYKRHPQIVIKSDFALCCTKRGEKRLEKFWRVFDKMTYRTSHEKGFEKKLKPEFDVFSRLMR